MEGWSTVFFSIWSGYDLVMYDMVILIWKSWLIYGRRRPPLCGHLRFLSESDYLSCPAFQYDVTYILQTGSQAVAWHLHFNSYRCVVVVAMV